MPRRLTRRMISKRRSVSGWGIVAVGSSSTSSETWPSRPWSARAMAMAVRSTGCSRPAGGAHVNAVADALDGPAGGGLLSPPMDAREPAGVVAEPQCDVVDGVQRGHQPKVLVHEPEAGVVGGLSVAQLVVLASHLRPCSGIGGVEPRKDLDERGLSRAVLTDEGVDLTGRDVEVDIDQRPGARKRLAERAQLDGRRGGRRLDWSRRLNRQREPPIRPYHQNSSDSSSTRQRGPGRLRASPARIRKNYCQVCAAARSTGVPP